MNVVIIEDELIAAEDLADTIKGLDPGIHINAVLHSVRQATTYFAANRRPDLIFSDIQLGDGQSFEIFSKVRIDCPVIFCTAYDAHALEAFRNNGIGYILKPFSRRNIKECLDKYTSLKGVPVNRSAGDYAEIAKSIDERSRTVSPINNLLVHWKDRIIPIQIRDVAAFYIDFKMVQLVTVTGQRYSVSYTLDKLEEICGTQFYRANRQVLLNRDAVVEATQDCTRKLLVVTKVDIKQEILISKNKVPEFLDWLRS